MSEIFLTTVIDLVNANIIAPPMDGNHGEAHPKSEDYVSDGIPFIMASDLVSGHVDFQKCKFIQKNIADTLRKGFAYPDDVLLSHKATIGRIAIVQKNPYPYVMLTPQVTFYRVIDKTKLLPHFLRYYFETKDFQEVFSAWAGGGSTRSYLGITAQLKLPIFIPPLHTQTAISSILGSLDDKIDLNRRTNETLEAMAQAMFRDWFVDFGPTRAKMAGEAPYLAPELWELFPDRLDDEGRPEGWKTEPLDETATFLNGLALQKYPATGDTSLPAIKIAQLRSENTETADPVSPDIPDDYIVEQNDLLFSWSGSLLCKFWNGQRGALNQHLFKVTSKRFEPWFIYEWIQFYMPEFQAIAAAKATTMGHIQRRHLTENLVTIPSANIMQAANKAIGSLIVQIQSNNGQSRTLAQLRDLLLPKLMSGEISIRDAEKMVKDAA
ncbi:restriction endonuclease subunit S [Acidomonas methanolica]|uniref:restriction endonuclease subunit S n=1 Tax=Acidomonas methanolica TaxID=437 RepID=UPI001C054330|nr:restriction endonuclease subunit S [Acidomonas methanolica]MBU2655734.1 restriction endonuclease subunit S [Acidomonas methanolica]